MISSTRPFFAATSAGGRGSGREAIDGCGELLDFDIANRAFAVAFFEIADRRCRRWKCW